MQSYFHRLFSYTLWANKKVLWAIESMSEPDEQSLMWFSHILSAQDIWLSRLVHEKVEDIPVWTVRDLDACKIAFRESHASWQRWFNAVQDHHFYDICHYQTTSGEAQRSTVGDIVAHVVNHGTHHRAQIVARLRALGQTPPATDFIFWVRQTEN